MYILNTAITLQEEDAFSYTIQPYNDEVETSKIQWKLIRSFYKKRIVAHEWAT